MGPVLHLSHIRKVLFPIALGITIWFFVGPWVSDHHWWGYAINVAAFIGIGVLIGTTHVHRKLYPWCPYCRWGDGGKEEVVPDPDPAESAS